MNVFFFLPSPGDCCHQLLDEVAAFVAKDDLEVFVDREAFMARTRRPLKPSSVALLWDPTLEDLKEIGASQGLWTNARTLLVLHDQDRETIALAHKLRPAYIAYIDDGIPGIVSVLKRLADCGAGGAGT